MNNFAAQIRLAAHLPLRHAPEHNANRARHLREEIKKSGKCFKSISAQELIAINKKIDEMQP